MSGQMIDWDLAVATATKLAGQGPTVSRTEADAGGRRAPRRRGALDAAGARVHRADRRGRHRPGPRRRPARAGSRPTRTRSPRSSSPVVDKLQERRGAPGPAHRGDRLPRHRPRGRRAARLPRRQGARPVRPLPRAGEPGDRPSSAGCCSSPPTSSTPSASSAPTRPTSGSGCACTRRPTACSSPRCRGCATTCRRRSTRSSTASTSTRSGSPPMLFDARTAGRRPGLRPRRHQPHRPVRHPGPARGHRPGDRRDVPARGARRRGHGRRRPRGDPHRRRDPPAVQPAPQGHGLPRPAGPAAARAGREDGAVPRRRALRPHGRRQGRHGRASTRCGSSPPTCRPRTRSATRQPGSAASTADRRLSSGRP